MFSQPNAVGKPQFGLGKETTLQIKRLFVGNISKVFAAKIQDLLTINAESRSETEEKKPARKKSQYVLDEDYGNAKGEDTVLVPEIDLRVPMALGRPQMAESRKVKGKRRKFTFFGLLKESK